MYTQCYLAKREEDLATWHTGIIPPLPNARSWSASCLINEVPWVIGGFQRQSTDANFIIVVKGSYYYDNDQWNSGPELPVRLRYNACVAISATEALIIGGDALVSNNPYITPSQNAVYKLDTIAETITPYAHDLPQPLKFSSPIKVTLSGDQEAVLTVGGSQNTIYKSVLPDGNWEDVGATMGISAANMYMPFCTTFKNGGYSNDKIICAYTRMNTPDSQTLVHEFNPDGPPFWTLAPFTMTDEAGKNAAAIYTRTKIICC